MTKAPCEAALIGERHVRIEISDFVMRTFVLLIFLPVGGGGSKMPALRQDASAGAGIKIERVTNAVRVS